MIDIENGAIGQDSSIYWRILQKIKRDLADIISFILVYDDQGKYMFSTSRNYNQMAISSTIITTISKYVQREYRYKRYSHSLIGAKILGNSVIWHFKCFNRIFVFLTYRMPEMHTFSSMKSDLMTFITNNLWKFISASDAHERELEAKNQVVQNSRFIFLT